MTGRAAPVRWDRQIQRRLARGEESALGELYDQLGPTVHSVAFRVLSDRAAAERLTRDVFAEVWARPEVLDPARGPLRAGIGALAHRRAVERLRSRHAPSPAPPAAEVAGRTPAAFEEEARAAARAARARQVMDAMPAPVREALRAAYAGGHTYRQTARLLGVSEATAKHRMRLGLQLLASALPEGGGR